MENCIFIFKNAFYKKLILWRRLCLKKQQKEAAEPVNNAFAQALAGLKLD